MRIFNMPSAAQAQQFNLQKNPSPLLLQPMHFQGNALKSKHVGFKARPITQWGSLLALLASLGGCSSGGGFKPTFMPDSGTQTHAFKNPEIIPLPDDFGALIRAPEAKRPNLTKETSDWAPNVKVYASSSQAISSWFNPNEYSYFTQNLMKRLKSASSLDAAYESMARYGYLATVNPDKENPAPPPSSVAGKTEAEKKPSPNVIKRFFPTATKRPNTAWAKADHSPPRYVLLLAEGSDAAFARNCQLVQDTLMDDIRGFGVCEENIKRFDKATPTEVEAGLKWLEQQVASNPQAEVLIYIASHGSPDYGLKPDSPEGSGYGFIGIGVSKTVLKQSIAQHLKAAKQVSIILDSCHAGNWIAMDVAKAERKTPAT